MSLLLAYLPADASDEKSLDDNRKTESSSEKKKRSLSDICMVLVSDGKCTYIPKDAVLYAPDHLKSKMGRQLQGTFVSWDKFNKGNHGWIYLHQVSRKQASGNDHIKPETVKAYKTHNKMVIAHNYGNIISVRPEAFELPTE